MFKLQNMFLLFKLSTLLALITLNLNDVNFRNIAWEGPKLYVYIEEFDRVHLKNDANSGRRWKDRD